MSKDIDPVQPLSKTISITRREYHSMRNDQMALNCLYSVGVVNWEKFDEAMEKWQAIKDKEWEELKEGKSNVAA